MAESPRKRSRALALVAIMVVLSFLAAACGDDDSDDSDDASTDETIGEFVDDALDDSGESDETVEPTAVDLEVAPITVGAFVIAFTELEIVPNEFDPELYTVNLSFSAENELPDLRTPLAIGLDAIVMEAKSGFLTGARVETSDVPGGRTGTGTLTFDGSSDIDVSEIPSAILVFGSADQNQPSVALDGSRAEPFSTIPVDIAVNDVSGVTKFEISGGEIAFRDALGNLLDKDRAILTMSLITSATDQTGPPGEYIGVDRVTLDRPDGTSIAPEYLNRAMYPGHVVDEPVDFQLRAPFEGEYTLNIGDEIAVTFTVG